MIKICPRCRRTFSGGIICLHCTEQVALLDVANLSVQRAHLRGDGELRTTLRTYYGARSAMLLMFWSILFGLAFGIAFVRKGFGLEGLPRVLFFGLGLAAALALPFASALLGTRLVHRFTKSCRRKPLQASDLRVVRRDQDNFA